MNFSFARDSGFLRDVASTGCQNPGRFEALSHQRMASVSNHLVSAAGITGKDLIIRKMKWADGKSG